MIHKLYSDYYFKEWDTLDLFYGIQNGNLVHIDEVKSGLTCSCYCPCCNSRLVAKKGEYLIHHFAHEKHSSCRYKETMLHLTAKQILGEEKCIRLPEVEILGNSDFRRRIVSPDRVITFDRVDIESFQKNMTPDLICYSGDKRLYIEITVTHGVDYKKVIKVQEQGVSLLEINLSYFQKNLNAKILRNQLVNGLKYKEWRFNKYAERKEKDFLDNHKGPTDYELGIYSPLSLF